MIIKAGHIIKHPKFMDVAFMVTRVREPYGREQKREVMGEWLNQGYVNSWSLGIRETIKLTEKQWSEWQICQESAFLCLRYVRWS